jgi:hypothetical protein
VNQVTSERFIDKVIVIVIVDTFDEDTLSSHTPPHRMKELRKPGLETSIGGLKSVKMALKLTSSWSWNPRVGFEPTSVETLKLKDECT